MFASPFPKPESYALVGGWGKLRFHFTVFAGTHLAGCPGYGPQDALEYGGRMIGLYWVSRGPIGRRHLAWRLSDPLAS